MLLLIPTTLARGVDEAELRGIIEQLRPRVEAATGRTFESLPKSAIDDRAHVRATLVERPPWATPETWDAAAAGRRADLVLTNALAIYSPNHDTLFLLSDAMREAFSSVEAGGDLVRPIVQCVVAHELTHALQYRTVARPFLDAGQDLRSRLPIEGHASWVEQRVCPEKGRAAHDALTGRELLGSVDRDDAYVYTYMLGAELVDAYVQRYGNEAWWWRLDQPAPTPDAVHTIADARLVKQWRDAAPLGEALRAMPGLEHGLTDLTTWSPSAFLRALSSGGQHVRLPDLHLGATMHAEVVAGGEAAASAFAWLVGSNAEAAAIVATRRTQIGTGFRGIATVSPTPILLTSRITTRALPAKQTPSGASETLWVSTNVAGGGVYQELWVARGPITWLLGWRGKKRDRDLLATLTRLTSLPLDANPVGVDNDPAATAALTALAPPASLPAPTRSALWVASQLDPTAPRACAAAANAAVAEVGVPGRAELVQVGILCAEDAGDPGTIRALAARVADEEVLATAAASLAVLREYGSAASVAKGITATRPELWAVRRGVELLDAAARRDWAQVRASIKDPAIPELARGNAAIAMWNAGKVDEARVVLRGLCLGRAPGETPPWCGQVPAL